MSMYSNKFRHALLGASAMVSAAAVASAAYAADARQFDFDMPAQPLTLALKTFGATADQQLIFSEALVKDRTAPPLKGSYTPDQALAMLLGGTGLIADKTPGGVVTIRSASDPQGGSAADGAEGTVQALVVTAQKREENIQDVPIAMSAFTQEDLTKSQVAGGPDLMTQVPNFTFTKTNFSGYSIQIRGIGTQAISATTDAAVAVAFNNTPFIRNRFFEQEFYDLQRVEVLRGPQGTLYGRNATAGVVNVISAKPKFAYEARLSADVANYNSTRLEGMVNIPLVDDKVALRLAGAWTKRDGYDTNQITGNQIDGRDLWSTRLSLRFEPTDFIHANLIWEHFQEDDDRLRSGKQLCHRHVVTNLGPFQTNQDTQLQDYGQDGPLQASLSQGCTAASLYAPESFETPNGLSLPYYVPLGMVGLPGALPQPYASTTQSRGLRVIESTVDPTYRAKTDLAELQFNADLPGNLTFTAETGYLSDELFAAEDYNRFNTATGAWRQPGPWYREGVLREGTQGGVFCDPQIGCSDRLVALDLSTARSRQFSQEFRLSSTYARPLNFSLGANFLRYDTEDKYYVFINSVSLYSAMNRAAEDLPTYITNIADNKECLPRGKALPDPAVIGEVQSCMYIDPNPIGSLNDQGHNYFLSKNPYNLMSYALFGEAFYKIKENLKLTAGLRWTVDQKQAPLIPSQLLVPNSTGYPVLGVTKQEWREPTGRLAIDWKPDLSISDETLIYASYAHGYKAGGANPPPAAVVCYACANDQGVLAQHSPVHPATFDPEFVNAFEVGSKNTLLDGSITLNGDAFYYDYKDYQISQIVDRSAINMNFDARVWGVELEADWHPLENLRVGFKGGYENARVADGMRAIDVMDRTAGNPDWVAARPFPTYTSNCVLPVWLFIGNWPDWLSTANPDPVNVGGVSGGNPSGCEEAYVFGRDPATKMPYVPDPYGPNGLPASQLRLGEEFRTGIDYAAWSTDPAHYPCWPSGVQIGTLSYPGVDPQCLAALSNNGAGFFKDLGGNELPNAPHFTATVSADYTLPLPSDWLMTLHGDFYYQSEAWARIFNTPGYDKLKAYTNVNLAAIFSNEDAGWKIMAYVKNVFDRDSITGAFLNSDDTGLTTNVFLTEPRLYGLRVTKEWTGGPWWTGANPNHTGPYAFTVELGGEVQRQKAAYETLAPALFSDFPSELDTTTSQHRRMDRGDGREVRLTYQPDGSPWMVAAAYRYGRVNTETTRVHSEIETAKVCGLPTTGPFGPAGRSACDPTSPKYTSTWVKAPQSWSDSEAHSREEHTVVDFAVARDVGLGRFKSMLGVGVRYAQLKAETFADMSAVPYEYIPDGWRWKYMHHTRYEGSVNAHREFTGEGPVVNWDGSAPFLGNDNTGHLNIDGSVSAGVLFGKQKVAIEGAGMSRYYKLRTFPKKIANGDPQYVDLGEAPRSTSASVPVVDLSLGLSYDIQRIKLSTGYRWERYFNAIDGGYAEHKSYDRTIDGPYFKIAVGFGG